MTGGTPPFFTDFGCVSGVFAPHQRLQPCFQLLKAPLAELNRTHREPNAPFAEPKAGVRGLMTTLQEPKAPLK
jgi:hypothetical protein